MSSIASLVLMPFCDLCREHTNRRFRGSIPVVNIPPNVMKSLSTSDLESIMRHIEQGVSICKECRNFCSSGNRQECSREQAQGFKQGQKHQVRTLHDRRTLRMIKEEIQKRNNIARFMLLNGNLPKAPTTAL